MFLLTSQWLRAWFSLGGLRWAWDSDVAGTRLALGTGNKSHENPTGVFVPHFVIDYAPYVHLYSQEIFLPGDIGEHLEHTIPYLNYTPLTPLNTRQSLTSLSHLNRFGPHVYLTSDDDPETQPPWLRGEHNRPVPIGRGETNAGASTAPGIIIWTEKENNVTDAFYFYFYSFNLGNTVAGWRFGNHVGDWEHTAVRFRNGVPQSIFYSEHSSGAAYEYGAVEKIGIRPVCYSARGSHANYARPGTHYYAIPFHLLADRTDKGPLWDITKNSYIYKYDIAHDVLKPSRDTPDAPVDWFHFGGRWGDRMYKAGDRRQWMVAGQYHYVHGPTGPKFKNLARKEICQNEGVCVVRSSLTEEVEIPSVTLEGWDGDGADEWVDLLDGGEKMD
ncbi:hypothetical protein C7212DRAFT_280421 [Tuber magnatum]|uniref:Vacuolar protein sorting-associated protein 62 n=1 Tax=Tuber magnatum TaxID=42249 RepID=A0A317SN99_9PEZI|nr:hypothetical protein C7212DRAFT_280421 [Tuber magnatum]